MKKFLVWSWATLLALMNLSAQTPKSVVYQEAEVRLTLIADGAIRLEYAPEGKWVDNKSFIAVNREYAPVSHQVSQRGKWVEIRTPKMKVRYRKGSGAFTAENLQIASVGLKPEFVWKPGMKQRHNLRGTYRTLDQLDGDLMVGDGYDTLTKGKRLELEEGLLARDGWTLIDDSKGLLFDGDPTWEWVKERPQAEGQDWYFLAYGHDYRSALKDFTRFAGQVPLPPRYAFGYWWSRYWSYSDKEVRELVDKFRRYDIPLDVLVIDMDWHYTEKGKGGWTGWTWNRNLFPDHRAFLQYLKKEQLKITLNLHPADGFASYEECFPRLAKAMGVDATRTERIPWVSSDKNMFTQFFRQVLEPMEQEGVDFWWLDWQQRLNDPVIPSLKNTWWINYAFFSYRERFQQRRPMLYHRWGGLGNHRYQIGFSGDAIISWKSLDYQPYFNATASNVLYGYWSHDLGGHMWGRVEPEMYVRWMQFGALSPIMRTHSSKDAKLVKDPWNFAPEVTDILRQCVLQRYEMAPYIYTMARKCHDEALSLCRPLYYDYPDCEEAYTFRNEYMFGDQMLVAPITAPAKEGYAELNVWLPEGSWYELSTGTLLEGGQTVKRSFALDEYPIYIKAGSILPFHAEKVQNLERTDEALTLHVFPGADGEFTLYEDNGDDQHYRQECAWTPLKSVREGNQLKVTIGPRTGHYRGMPQQRRYTLQVHASQLPTRVTVNGVPASYTYQGEDFSLQIPLGDVAGDEAKQIEITYAEGEHPDLTHGLLAQSRRIGQALTQLRYRFAGLELKGELGPMGVLSEAVSYHPETLPTLVKAFQTSYSDLPAVLRREGLKQEDADWFLKAIHWE